jgi:hypothetical protein
MTLIEINSGITTKVETAQELCVSVQGHPCTDIRTNVNGAGVPFLIISNAEFSDSLIH